MFLPIQFWLGLQKYKSNPRINLNLNASQLKQQLNLAAY